MQCLVRSKFAFRRPWNPLILESEWHYGRQPHISQIQIQPDRPRDVGTVLISTVRRDLVHFPVPISGLLHRLT